MTTPLVRQAKKEHSEKLKLFNSKLATHVFAFQLIEPSFKELHDAVQEDGEFYRLAVGLGPACVERYHSRMREVIGEQSQTEKDAVIRNVQHSIAKVFDVDRHAFNDFCQSVNAFNFSYFHSNNPIYYLKQREKENGLLNTIAASKDEKAYRVFYQIKQDMK